MRPSNAPNRGWHSRGYLPHFDTPELTQGVTFRLKDAVPSHVIEGWKQELKWVENPSTTEETLAVEQQRVRLHRMISTYEDAGHGECLLARPEFASIVENALQHFHGERYSLIAWCLMPNHVHVLVRMFPDWPLGGLIHSWKRFSASEINQLLGRQGSIWAPDYYDRFIRDEEHFQKAVHYIHQNPVKAGLCQAAEGWKWSSAKQWRESL